MKIAFIPSNVSGVAFYRAWQPAQALRKLGHKVAVLWYQHKMLVMHPWEEDIGRENTIIRDVHMAYQWADAIVWMGLHTNESLNLFSQMLRHYDKPTLTEIDDNIIYLPQSNAGSEVYRPGSPLMQIVIEQIKASDAVIVSTPNLKELYSDYNASVHVVENAIDLKPWRRSSPRRQGTSFKIGWMGGGTHQEDLALVRDALAEVLQKCPHVVVDIINGAPQPEAWKNIPRLTWTHAFKKIDKYPAWIASRRFDLGIAPLVDNDFNRGKSNLRWLEYSAMGIPTVASPLTHFVESIKEGQTGFFADSKEEWVKCLSLLVENPEVVARVGRQAQAEVKKNWSPLVMGRKYEKILKAVIASAKSHPKRSSH